MTNTLIYDNFNLISTQLKLTNFFQLKPRDRDSTLTTAENLFDQLEEPDKRRLAAYLQAIARDNRAVRLVKKRIQSFLKVRKFPT